MARSFSTELGAAPRGENRDEVESASAAIDSESAGRFYLPELDILRFFAFLSVFAVHACISFPTFAPRIVERVVFAGLYGVDLFFALSGYLLTQLLTRELVRRGGIDVRAFYIRRALRIWPLYFFFLGVVFALSATFRDSRYATSFTAQSTYFSSYLFFIGNFANCRLGPPVMILSPLWTVSVEEQVYLLFPWAIRKATPLGVALVGAALFAIANFARIEYAYHSISGMPVWFSTWAHLDSIGIGILLAAVPPARFAAIARTRRIVLGATGIACWLVAINYYSPLGEAETPLQEILSYPLAALGSGTILASVIGLSAGKVTSLPARLLVYLGRISYGLYVYHSLGIILTKIVCSSLNNRVRTDLSLRPLCPAVSLMLTLALAAASYKWLEAPFLRLKERFTLVASRPV